MERVKDFFAGSVARVVRQSVGIEAYQIARDMGNSRLVALGHLIGELSAPALYRVNGTRRLITAAPLDSRPIRYILKLTVPAYVDIVGGVGGMRLVETMLNTSNPEDAMLNIAAQWGIKLFYNAAVHTVANLLHDAGRPNIGIPVSHI